MTEKCIFHPNLLSKLGQITQLFQILKIKNTFKYFSNHYSYLYVIINNKIHCPKPKVDRLIGIAVSNLNLNLKLHFQTTVTW